METKRAGEKNSPGIVLPFVPRPLNQRVRPIKSTYQSAASTATKRKHPHPPVLVIERLDGSSLLSVDRIEAKEKS